ncbi:MAG: GNAT family N-acetyltransferase [Parvibaculum sp.]|uniref:GNAT family N-acetyltransferase n=1 Tax=Parvibaculum sp. TaxID=2024848 RepID=UPI002ABAA0D9|nr:GNAT family N-acetyltransferase [Parvibaculum sp.]MDZ4381545.1 GNAT family N-acetyltransferase [Parvibaculum sp.]
MKAISSGLRFCSHYAADKARREALNKLIEETFDIDLTPLVELDFEDPNVVPFSYFDEDGRCVANASVYPVRTMLGGVTGNAFAMQSVATRPEWRLNGLFRDLVTRALEWCDARRPLVMLKTDTPALYVRFGFGTRPRARFFVKTKDAPVERVAVRDIEMPRDAELLKRLLRERTPVSNRISLTDYGTVFFLEAVSGKFSSLHYVPDHDVAIAVSELPGGTLRIDNAIGRTIPPLPVLLGALGTAPDVVEFAFPPDLFGVDAETQPLVQTSAFMMRGAFPGTCEPFGLPLGGI